MSLTDVSSLNATQDNTVPAKSSKTELLEKLKAINTPSMEREPWVLTELPDHYYPWPQINFEPPIFLYGVAMTEEEIAEFALHVGIPDVKGKDDALSRINTVTRQLCEHLTHACGLEDRGRHISLQPCDSREGRWAFTLATNFTAESFRALFIHANKVLVQEFKPIGKEPKWYLQRGDNTKGDWSIPLSVVRRSSPIVYVDIPDFFSD
ncbi:hypothetical protein VNI00_011942 [Paramarasmius palmivorus]|uniref:Uncharacterized protein n=1 Tax=Paramarasmius palmivorus TaxID=297713 RepID=A0AAW0C9Q3_9AGAR